MQPVNAGQLKRFDYIITDQKIKQVTRNAYGVMIMEDQSPVPSAGTVYAIRGYQLTRSFVKWSCPVCNGTGGSTQTVGTKAVIGNDFRVVNQTGNSTTVQYVPVYTKLPGFTVKIKCSACNGFANKTTDALVTEVIR